MTSATVSQLSEMFINIGGNTGNTAKQNGDFAEIFQTAADKSGAVNAQESSKMTATESAISVSKTADKFRETCTKEVQNTSKDTDAVKKELGVAVKELKEEIAEKLEITVEELEKVMETLGLTDASLFTQEGMTALIMEIEQISTPIELLTNADVYQILQELNAQATELLRQIQAENQLTDEQMQEALAQLSKNAENSQEVMVSDEEVQNLVDNLDSNENDNSEMGRNTEIESSITTEDVTLAKDEASLNSRENSTGSESKEQNATQNQQMMNNLLTNNTQTVNQVATDFTQNIYEGQVSAQEIYDQIGEYIKTNINPGVSEVEMQLNPESLGSLHIHLSSKQGNVTAQFVVQNEAVKAALEMQMIQLKENFAEQGIKVEAVEITVETYSFDQNTQQGNEGNADAESETKRTGIRSINLNEDFTEEELTEDEQLVAEMMEANGNTVNLMA